MFLTLLVEIIISNQRGALLIVNANYHNTYLKINILNNKYFPTI